MTERGGGRGRQHSRPKEKYVQRPYRQREHVCSGTLREVQRDWGSPRAGTGVWREDSGWSRRTLCTIGRESRRRTKLRAEESSVWIYGNMGRGLDDGLGDQERKPTWRRFETIGLWIVTEATEAEEMALDGWREGRKD